MVMDAKITGYYGATSGTKVHGETVSVLSDPDLINSWNVNDGFANRNYGGILPANLKPSSSVDSFVDRNYRGILPAAQPDINSSSFVPSSEIDTPDDYDFSDVVLKYISEMLMEEDMEEKACMFQESSALQAAEKSLYEVLGEKYPPSPDHHEVPNTDDIVESLDENYIAGNNNYAISNTVIDEFLCPNWNYSPSEYEAAKHVSVDSASRLTSHSSYSSSSSTSTVTDGPVDSPESTLRIPDIFSDSQSIMQFKKGVEEANKFLPNGNGLLVNMWHTNVLGKEQIQGPVVKAEKKYENELYPDKSRGRKNPHNEDMDLQQGRSNKQSAVYSESTVRSEMFDMVLLCSGGKNESALRESLQNGTSKSTGQYANSKGSNGGKSRGKKQGGKRNVVDLRTLLTLCAQAVAADDRRTANEFLKQIREHSSPTGDGMQRLAHYFAHGLEARMAGAGTQVYKALIDLPASAADILKAYQLYLATCPFRKISNFFSNKTIMNVSEKSSTVHIIDFGILYGFQWPCLIQRLSSRPGGPPKLRITGVDLPCPGFRPSERVEETGRRLANYAETFKVPFEFNAIAQKWETIKIEDLKIEKDEVLVVNCLYRFRNLLDETVIVNSPRNTVLHLIRKMNPDVFVQGIVNGAYNAPFFITRFREALFHFSSLFDMLEANVPREIHERMLIERTIFGREAMNVIACEAAERIERPETYKQWQVRNLRAGFKQLPLNEEILKIAKNRVKSSYHKDFVIDEDGRWLLLGWKGRIVYALSSWKPAN